MELNELASVYVVSDWIMTAMGQSKSRKYKYVGLVSHSLGQGILGFKKIAQSSWIVNGLNTPIWQVKQINPQQRGASNSSWSFSGNDLSLIKTPIDSKLLNKSQMTYLYTQLADKRYVLFPSKEVEKDFLSGVSQSKTYTYDAYYNITKSLEEINGNTMVSETVNTYLNNPAGVGANYYIGRLTKVNTKNTAYQDVFTTEENYTYTGNLITQSKKKGHNTDFITETIKYDAWGNLIEKTTSAPNMTARTIKDKYDVSARFVIQKTDVLEDIVSFTYNNLGQQLSQKDKFNVITTTAYDNWGELKKITTTGASTTALVTDYTYARDANGWSVISSNAQTKAYAAAYYNALGRNIRNTVKGFNNGSYISTHTNYDFLGRKTRESEPILSSQSPSQWNTTSYDYLSRPISHTAYNGMITTTTYSGLSVTTKNEVKFKTVTKDAAGSLISVNDNGALLITPMEDRKPPIMQAISLRLPKMVGEEKLPYWTLRLAQLPTPMLIIIMENC